MGYRSSRPPRLPIILGGIAFALPLLLYARLLIWSHTNGMFGPAALHKQIQGGLVALLAGAFLFGVVWGLTRLIARALSNEAPSGDENEA